MNIFTVTYFVIEMKSLLLPPVTSYYILNLFIYKIINHELLACLLARVVVFVFVVHVLFWYLLLLIRKHRSHVMV